VVSPAISPEQPQPRHVSIWWWAFGYFAAYAPYSFLTKALSEGKLGPAVSGNTILPVSTFASVVGMVLFIGLTGWWRSATQKEALGRRWPVPTLWTGLSGLTGATILTTTTLAYTFHGVSIVFMMLLMRGGVLAMAPIVDAVSGRKVRWWSWVALFMCFVALVLAFLGRVHFDLSKVGEEMNVSGIALANVAAYLAAYFVRLRFMSRLAKSDSVEGTRRYFVEEQLVSTPAAFLALAVLALVDGENSLHEIRLGFTELPFGSMWPWAVLIGVLSQGTGIFGALVLLDKSENSFSVPVNRASSVLAGVLATAGLWLVLGEKPLDLWEGVGAVLVIGAIVVLSLPQLLPKKAEPRA
jgi:uncharacterized membrane protein YdcZ (DUF606 family)